MLNDYLNYQTINIFLFSLFVYDYICAFFVRPIIFFNQKDLSTMYCLCTCILYYEDKINEFMIDN